MQITDEFLKIILETSGVLFGLTFAAISYAHQSVTTTYSFCKDIFIDLYTEYSKLILVPLGFSFVLSIKILFINNGLTVVQGTRADWIDGLLILAFSLVFVKIRLDYYKSLGYIHTIFSNKIVPKEFGPAKAYFRQILNLGFLLNMRIRIGFGLLLGYPLYIGFDKSLEFIDISQTIIYLLVFLIIYVLFKVVAFIPITTEMQKLDIQKKFQESPPDTQSINKAKEFELLERYLVSRGFKENGIINEKRIDSGDVYYEVLKNQDRNEGWINVFHNLSSSNIETDKSAVFGYAYELIKVLNESKNDIATFVISNHITFENSKKENLFIRIMRSEMPAVLSEGSPEKAIKAIKNTIVNNMFK